MKVGGGCKEKKKEKPSRLSSSVYSYRKKKEKILFLLKLLLLLLLLDYWSCYNRVTFYSLKQNKTGNLHCFKWVGRSCRGGGDMMVMLHSDCVLRDFLFSLFSLLKLCPGLWEICPVFSNNMSYSPSLSQRNYGKIVFPLSPNWWCNHDVKFI